MAQNLPQSSPYEDEIDLIEIFKILIESKKLIISSILIFTIASIIYSLSLKPSFITSTKLEIGYVELDNGDRKLIESLSDLISDLNILLMKNPDDKFNQNVSMNSLENKIISLETTSSSVEQNENILNEMISYIDERHSNLAALITYQKKDKISNEINLIESEISFLIGNMRIDLEAKISKIKSDLPIIDQEISQLNLIITQDLNNLKLLRNTNLDIERAANSLEQIIFSYKNQISQLKRERNNSISDLSSFSQKLDALDKSNFQSDELFILEQEQKILENQLQTLMNKTQVKTLPIGNIETQTIKPKTQLMILLGIIMGFITGILLVFIRNFVKSYRESQA